MASTNGVLSPYVSLLFNHPCQCSSFDGRRRSTPGREGLWPDFLDAIIKMTLLVHMAVLYRSQCSHCCHLQIINGLAWPTRAFLLTDFRCKGTKYPNVLRFRGLMLSKKVIIVQRTHTLTEQFACTCYPSVFLWTLCVLLFVSHVILRTQTDTYFIQVVQVPFQRDYIANPFRLLLTEPTNILCSFGYFAVRACNVSYKHLNLRQVRVEVTCGSDVWRTRLLGSNNALLW
jgi:hypothetical protein